jgi:DNA-binding MarR family transcriptional regulator
MSVDEEVESLVRDWERERPDLDMSTLGVSLPLRRALQLAEARRGALLAARGVTPATLDLLVALRRLGSPYRCTPSDLARTLVLSAGRVSQRLDALERAGLVERSVSSADRRVVFATLSDKGFRTIDELIGPYMDHEESLLHGLSPRQRTTLSQLLVQLEASIRSAPEPDRDES